ncbi:hypothetical protein J19TS2_37720 [Cohnella xylanilytica]|uniref:DUF4025 domain-containing protein n=1 Tax=Cohnella xylanilytica TaxID=557555 RepID=A0A841TXF3_9BACL|nr:hypothetical protein [Cohnella xylanilytica]MBB6690550.1 hypothetical protein [Cohnella xylanilytica]GIO14217.1 hypothetical protein J19TS2_37720 [Cohnella xylanilytica]
MATSRNHQGAHGIGQVEEQLDDQIEAAVEIQGESEIDGEIERAARQPYKESDEEKE